MPEALIIGLGNTFCGDDAAGILAARELQRRNSGGYAVREHEGEHFALIDLWTAYSPVVLIDAIRSGGRVGTIHRFDATTDPLPITSGCGSTHCWSAADAIELGRTLRRLPARLILYGVEAKGTEPGRPISRAVRQAIPEIVRRVWEELRIPAVRE